MGPRLLYALIVGAVILAALSLRVWDPSPVARLRALVFDSYQRLSPREFDASLPVRIVDIDEESLKRIGQWPWPRTVLAELVDKLAAGGAAAIGFDMVFPEPDRMSPANALRYWPRSETLAGLKEELEKLPSNDEVFSESIAGSPVVLGFIASPQAKSIPVSKAGFAHGGDDPKLFAPYYPGAAVSLEQFQAASSGNGSLNWIPENDQIIRRMPMIVRVGDTLYPSFAGEMLRLAQGASTYVVKSSGASGERAFGEKTGIVAIKVGDFEVPTEAHGQMWVRFTAETPERYYPAWKVLNGEIGADEIDGRILLIGTSAAGLLDLRATPLDPSVPGVSLHAQAIEQILQDTYLQRPDFATAAELLYILVLGMLIAVLIYRMGALGSAALGAVAIAAVIGVSWYAFDVFGWLVDPIYPAIALAAIYLAGTLFVFLRTERERNRVRNAFSHYMAPALVERLAGDPTRLKLGGETRDMTLLFSDVRGFTGISEGLDAEELTRFLNSLFTPLSNIILDEQGTIDKFMGDAVMAFWNAPLDDDAHPVHACNAALRMMREMESLNERWREEADAKGRPYKPVQLGIGLNTGVCCVGNLGSETRFDYSVIGDNVNVASRLEGQCEDLRRRHRGRRIHHPARTRLRLSRTRPVEGEGQDRGHAGFRLARRQRHEEARQDFIALTERHRAFLARFRAKDWDAADVLSRECQQINGARLDGLYALYRERIAQFRINPPPPDWDGTAEALSK
jgi:adenylate cyclase